MLVSEMEKNAETTSRTTNAISSVWSGISSKCGHHRVVKSKSVSAAGQTVSRQSPLRLPTVAMQLSLSVATALRARIYCRYRREPATGNRRESGEQRREDDPGEDAEHSLVCERHRLAEQGFRKQDATTQREREQHEAG